LAFQLALGAHFRHAGPLAPQMRGLVILSAAVWAAAMVYLASRGAPGTESLVAAIVLLALAALLFALTRVTTPSKVLPAAFADEAPAFVIDRGPYRFIRHPFYTAYMLYWIGLAFAAPHPVVVIGAMLIVVAYVFAARREERSLLNGPLGASYASYMRSTGRFLPRLGSGRP
jgi:protein-S-isoprenylcysteine O-methyltransferase Ste14